MSIEKPDRDLNKLFPPFKEKIISVINEIQLLGYEVDVYEAYRSPERQEWLFASARSRPGPLVTNARGGCSAHQWGLAGDLVGKLNGKWSWDSEKIPYKKFREVYISHGLEVLLFEDAHVQRIAPFTNADLKNGVVADYVRIHGLQALWDKVKV